MIPGGLTRYPPLADLLDFAERVGTRPHEAAKKGPCDARQARRNHVTSAAVFEVRYAPRYSHRSRPATLVTLRNAPLMG